MSMTGRRHPAFSGFVSAESYTRKIPSWATRARIAYICCARSGPIVVAVSSTIRRSIDMSTNTPKSENMRKGDDNSQRPGGGQQGGQLNPGGQRKQQPGQQNQGYGRQ